MTWDRKRMALLLLAAALLTLALLIGRHGPRRESAPAGALFVAAEGGGAPCA